MFQICTFKIFLNLLAWIQGSTILDQCVHISRLEAHVDEDDPWDNYIDMVENGSSSAVGFSHLMSFSVKVYLICLDNQLSYCLNMRVNENENVISFIGELIGV